MNKARTGKALSAVAIANLAVAGFVASPAIASAPPAVGTAGTTTTAMAVPSAGKVYPGLMLAPATRQVGAAGAKPRGFVPRARAGIKPDTAHKCQDDVCIAVYGAGLHVAYVEASWQGQPGVCRDGYLSFASVNNHTYPTDGCFYSHTVTKWNFNQTYASSFSICAGFNHVPGLPCIGIVRS
jgi:hypothetical protein